MIKKLTTFSALALAFAVAPAMAETGHVGVGYANNDESDVEVWGVEAASSYGFGDAFGAQIDGAIGSADDGFDSYTSWRASGHLFYNVGDFRVGAVVGGSQVNTPGNEPQSFHWGVEGQYWFDRVSLGANAVWGDADWIISPSIDYDNYDLSADFYATDNFLIGANYGVGSLDNGTSEADTTSYGVDAEWKFDSSPVSILAGYQHWEIDGSSAEADGWTIGARWNWGESLLARDRAGFRNSPGGLVDRFFGF